MSNTSTFWFPGLNGLRFFAAGLVVLMHTHINQGRMGLPQLPEFPIMQKGLPAVSLFFTLSGFLITYLLLGEHQAKGSISIKRFYLRRVFRIWPLYFLIIGFGLLFYWKLVPALGLPFESDYPLGLAIGLYTFFLANLMNSMYHVGGILNITWSIAVEEQFYLFWAPMVKRFYRRLPYLITGITVFSLTVGMLNAANAFHLSEAWQVFIRSLQFHYMGIGALFAWLLYSRKDALLQSPFFISKGWQVLLTSLLPAYFFFYEKSLIGEVLLPLPLGLLYGWLIVNVGANPNRIFSLEHPVLHYLGKISYGIYMYHMIVVYGMAFIFGKFTGLHHLPALYFPVYFGMTFGITILVAGISYHWLEEPLLKYSRQRASLHQVGRQATAPKAKGPLFSEP